MSSIGAVKIIAFDVFGTVVDWHGSIEREVEALNLGVNAADFARAWRTGYGPAMQRVRSGELGWTRIDVLHRMILETVLADFGITSLNDVQKAELNLAWHRLDPWPDTVAGLLRLKTRFTICTLSNGNISLLTDMAKRAGLPWDCILSAEVFRHYKPDREAYVGVAELFDLPPAATMLAAAHQDDLRGARAAGLKTAYIERALEFGAGFEKDVSADPANDLHARSILDLAMQLVP